LWNIKTAAFKRNRRGFIFHTWDAIACSSSL
jgi:hypothetical protein